MHPLPGTDDELCFKLAMPMQNYRPLVPKVGGVVHGQNDYMLLDSHQ